MVETKEYRRKVGEMDIVIGEARGTSHCSYILGTDNLTYLTGFLDELSKRGETAISILPTSLPRRFLGSKKAFSVVTSYNQRS